MAALLSDVCRIDGCDRPRHRTTAVSRRTVCGTHHSRKVRTGSYQEEVPVRPIGDWHHDHPSYETVHKRLTLRRGKATDYVCPCGEEAREWAYNHRDAQEHIELRSFEGREIAVAYSDDLDNYDPLCRSCHRKRDRQNNRKD